MTEEKKSMVPKLRFPEFTETWEQRKFEDLFTEYAEKGFNQYPALSIVQGAGTIERDKSNRNLSYSTKNLGNYKIVYKDDFILHLRSFEGGLERACSTGLVSPAYHVFHSDGVNSSFFYCIFRSSNFINRLLKPCVYDIRDGKSINISELKNIYLNVPGISEQKKIGDFFDSIDSLITLHQRKLDVLNKLKKYLLQKMFPENGQLIPELRFPAFSGAWEQRKLSEIVRMNARIGWQNLRQSEFLDDGDFLLITGTDFKNGRVNFGTCHYIAKERFDQDPKIQVEEGSILLTKDGTIGKVALVDKLSKPATLNAGVYNIVPKNRVVESRFLFQYLSAPFLLDYVNKAATGGTIKHLNQSILVDFPVSFPSVAEQEKIGKFLEGIDHVTTLHQRKLEGLRKLKKSLLQQMFV